MYAAGLAEIVGKTRLYLADVDKVSADEIRSAVRDFYRDFPTVGPLLADVKVDPEYFETRPTAYAVTSPEDPTVPTPPYRIRLNDKVYVNGRADLVRLIATDYVAGFHGYIEPIGNIEHELGHVVDLAAAHYCGLKVGASWDTLQYRDAQTISGYAVQSGPMEAWADAFAARRLGVPFGNQNVRRALDKVIAEATRS